MEKRKTKRRVSHKNKTIIVRVLENRITNKIVQRINYI